jgi:hypothetical protein
MPRKKEPLGLLALIGGVALCIWLYDVSPFWFRIAAALCAAAIVLAVVLGIHRLLASAGSGRRSGAWSADTMGYRAGPRRDQATTVAKARQTKGRKDFFSEAFREVMAEVLVPEDRQARLPALCEKLAGMEGYSYDRLVNAILEELGGAWTWQPALDHLSHNAHRDRQEEMQAVHSYTIEDYLSGMKMQALRKLYAQHAPHGKKTFTGAGKESIILAILDLIPAEKQEALLKDWKLGDLQELQQPIEIPCEQLAWLLAWRLQALAHAKFTRDQLSDPELLSQCPYWRYVFSEGVPYFCGADDAHEACRQWDGLVLRHDIPFGKPISRPTDGAAGAGLRQSKRPSQATKPFR